MAEEYSQYSRFNNVIVHYKLEICLQIHTAISAVRLVHHKKLVRHYVKIEMW